MEGFLDNIFGGGDSGSESRATTDIKRSTNILNESEINMASKNVNDIVNNVAMDQAQSCSSSATGDQTVNMSGTRVKKNLNVNISQNQEVSHDFSCVLIAEQKSQVANKTKTAILDSLESTFDNKALDKMEAEAKQSTESGMWGEATSSENNTNMDIEFNASNTTRKNIEKVVENSIKNNMDLNQSQECVSEAKNIQTALFMGMDIEGNANLKIDQDQVLESFSECVLEAKQGNKIIADVTTALGIEIKESSSTEAESDISSSTDQTTKSGGVGDAVGNAAEGAGSGIGKAAEGAGSGLGNAASGFGDMFSSFFSGLMMPFIISSVSCVLIIAAIFILPMLSGGGSSEPAAPDTAAPESAPIDSESMDDIYYGGKLLIESISGWYS